MQTSLTRAWGLTLFRGILAVLFGIIALIQPGGTTFTLIRLFGAFAVVNGIFALISAFRMSSHTDRWWFLIFEGAFGVIAGIIAFLVPSAVATAVVYIMAAWAVITGVLVIVAAVQLRKVIENEFWLGAVGALSVLVGILLFAEPGAGIVVWAWTIGIFALLYGAG
ncbi:MAG: DUF308 domain-containing protein, partial [Armatimonadota bacterium]